MFRWLVHLALIAAVIGCPMVCHIGSVCGFAGSAAQPTSTSCCPHCQADRGSPNPAKPGQPASDPPLGDRGLCQCFCGGGVLVPIQTVKLDDTLGCSAWNAALLDVSTPGPRLSALARLDELPSLAPTPSGRAICCWHTLWLC